MPTKPFSPHRGGLVSPGDDTSIPKHPHISRIRDVPPVSDWADIEAGSAVSGIGANQGETPSAARTYLRIFGGAVVLIAVIGLVSLVRLALR